MHCWGGLAQGAINQVAPRAPISIYNLGVLLYVINNYQYYIHVCIIISKNNKLFLIGVLYLLI